MCYGWRCLLHGSTTSRLTQQGFDSNVSAFYASNRLQHASMMMTRSARPKRDMPELLFVRLWASQGFTRLLTWK